MFPWFVEYFAVTAWAGKSFFQAFAWDLFSAFETFVGCHCKAKILSYLNLTQYKKCQKRTFCCICCISIFLLIIFLLLAFCKMGRIVFFFVFLLLFSVFFWLWDRILLRIFLLILFFLFLPFYIRMGLPRFELGSEAPKAPMLPGYTTAP